MSQYRIALLVGSLRRESINKQLATALTRMAPHDFVFHHCEIGDLPLYNQDDDSHQAAPVKRLKKEVRESDGLLFVTPEYNRSVPGVLKNAIDHASRPYGDSAWQGKPAGVVGASIGTVGTALSQQHLRNILAYLDVSVMGQPEAFIHAKEGFFDGDGNIASEGSRAFVQDWMDKYAKWIALHVDAARANAR